MYWSILEQELWNAPLTWRKLRRYSTVLGVVYLCHVMKYFRGKYIWNLTLKGINKHEWNKRVQWSFYCLSYMKGQFFLGITCTCTELNERCIRVMTLVYANAVGGWIMLYIQDYSFMLDSMKNRKKWRSSVEFPSNLDYEYSAFRLLYPQPDFEHIFFKRYSIFLVIVLLLIIATVSDMTTDFYLKYSLTVPKWEEIQIYTCSVYRWKKNRYIKYK